MFDFSSHFDLNLTYSIKVGFELYKLDLKYNGDKDSAFKVSSKIKINTELNVALPFIMGTINAIFDKGRSFSNILTDTPLCWLDLDQIYMVPNYGDTFLWGGLTPGYNPSRCPNGLPYGPQDDMIFPLKQFPKQLIQQILKNILSNLHELGDEFYIE